MATRRLALTTLTIWCGCQSASPNASNHATKPASRASCALPDGFLDADGDGFGDERRPVSGCATDSVPLAGDCDDSDPSVTLPQVLYWDEDTDGWGSTTPFEACAVPADAVRTSGDCDDTSADVNPDAVERCNGVDDDCDGLVDDADDAPIDALPWNRDADGDGYGNPFYVVTACVAPTGHVPVGVPDCDDTDAERAPDAVERCLNGIDDDCDGIIDEQCAQLLDGSDATLDGTASWDMLGSSVGVGDWDGDGIDDFAVGVPGSDARGEGAGDLHVLTASQLLIGGAVEDLPTIVLHGSPFDLLGFTLSPPVDLNRDGYDDLLLGLAGGGVGLPGAAVAVLGPVTASAALASVEAFRVTGTADYDGLGVRAPGVGPLTDPTIASLLIGVPGDDTREANAGAAVIVPASLEGPSSATSAPLRVVGESEDGALGTATLVTDLDGDGLNDIVLGEPGAARLVAWPNLDLPSTGATLSANAAPIKIFDTDPQTELGARLVADDIDGDGYIDLLIGAPAASDPYPRSGRWDLLPGPFTTSRRLDGPSTARLLDGSGRLTEAGSASSGVVVEDLDGDGTPDLILGGPGHWTAEVGSGGAFWFFGPVSGVLDVSTADRVVLGTVVEEAAGAGLAVGDPDQDGIPDLIVGAPTNEDDYGRVGLFLGNRASW